MKQSPILHLITSFSKRPRSIDVTKSHTHSLPASAAAVSITSGTATFSMFLHFPQSFPHALQILKCSTATKLHYYQPQLASQILFFFFLFFLFIFIFFQCNMYQIKVYFKSLFCPHSLSLMGQIFIVFNYFLFKLLAQNSKMKFRHLLQEIKGKH